MAQHLECHRHAGTRPLHADRKSDYEHNQNARGQCEIGHGCKDEGRLSRLGSCSGVAMSTSLARPRGVTPLYGIVVETWWEDPDKARVNR